jgi:hypothetical protein
VALGLGLVAQEQGPGTVVDGAAEAFGDGVVAVLAALPDEALGQVDDRMSDVIRDVVAKASEEAGFETGGAEDGVLGQSDALDGEQFLSVDGLVDGDEVGAESGNGLAILDADDGEIGGSEAMATGILGGAGLTGGGARAGGAGGVGAIGGVPLWGDEFPGLGKRHE